MTTGCDVLDFPIRPASVWDARTADYRNDELMIQAARCAWLVTHGLDGGRIFRVEFYLIDAPFARVFTYARDGEGRNYLDPATGKTALARPQDVLLADLPPARLL